MNTFIDNPIGVIASPARTVARAMEQKRWQAALVLAQAAASREGRVLRERGPVRGHGRQEGVQCGDFQGVRVLRVAGETQEVETQLHPRCRDARLHGVQGGFGLAHGSVVPEIGRAHV